MDFVNRCLGGIASALVLALSAAAPAMQRSADLTVLGRLEPGLWQLRNLDGGSSPPSVCLGDRAALAQLQHRRLACSRDVVGAARDSVEVRYDCAAAGFGQTTIRVETPRLARIESQGVDRGTPFGFRAEARRIGPCA